MTPEQQEIWNYLEGTLRVNVSALDAETPLFSSGVIDSFAMIDLITFLESKFGIRIEPGDITLDNFDSVGRMAKFLSNGA